MSFMSILPIPPSPSRTVIVSTTGVEGLQLAIGQEITARILAIKDQGQMMLDVKNRRFWAQSELQLEPGQTVNLKVLETGPEIHLQLISSQGMPQSPEELTAMASLVLAQGASAAKSEFDVLPLMESLKSLMQTLDTGKTNLPLEQLKQLLAPLSAGEDSRQFLQNLKIQLENSGLFFESRLRNLLENYQANPELALGKLASDVKVLLGQVNQVFEKSSPPSQPPFQTLATQLEELIAQILPEPPNSPNLNSSAAPAGNQDLLLASPQTPPPATLSAPTLVSPSIPSTSLPVAPLPADLPGQEFVQELAGQLQMMKNQVDSFATSTRSEVQKLFDSNLGELHRVRLELTIPLPPEVVEQYPSLPAEIKSLSTQLQQFQKELDLLKEAPELALRRLAGGLKALVQSTESQSSSWPEPIRNLLQPKLGSLTKMSQQIESALAQGAQESQKNLQGLSQQLQEIISKTENHPAFPLARFKVDPGIVLQEFQQLQMEVHRQLESPWLAADPAAIWKMAGELKGALADHLLARQADTALQWMRDGSFEAVIPVQYQYQQSPARIRFQVDPEGRKTKDKNHPTTVDIRIELPHWGKLEAWARWLQGQIDVKLYLEDSSIASQIETRLDELSNQLKGAGFRQVNVAVQVDPVRLYKKELTPDRPNAEGKLLSVLV
jgi:hypothetical protein